jgi:hypothetical protein
MRMSVTTLVAGVLTLSSALFPAFAQASQTHENVSTGFCLDSNEKGSVYAIQCNGGNYQNWE